MTIVTREDGAKKRGLVRDFTISTRGRLIKAMQRLSFLETEGAAVFLTLTTPLLGPKEAKKWLKGWVDCLRHKFRFKGVYCVEFQRNAQIHFHLVLRFMDVVGTDTLRQECFKRWDWQWEQRGLKSSNNARRLRAVDDWLRAVAYMAKYDPDKREELAGAWQKLLPAHLKETGLGSNWWGVVNATRGREKMGTVAPPTEVGQVAA